MKEIDMTPSLEGPVAEGTRCPHHGHTMVPLHAIEGGARRVVGLTCPEPYCDHVRMLTRDEAESFESQRRLAGAALLRSTAVGG